MIVQPFINQLFLHLGHGIQEGQAIFGLEVEIVVRCRVRLNLLNLVDGTLRILYLGSMDLKELRQRQIDYVEPVWVVVGSGCIAFFTGALLLCAKLRGQHVLEVFERVGVSAAIDEERRLVGRAFFHRDELNGDAAQ